MAISLGILTQHFQVQTHLQSNVGCSLPGPLEDADNLAATADIDLGVDVDVDADDLQAQFGCVLTALDCTNFHRGMQCTLLDGRRPLVPVLLAAGVCMMTHDLLVK